MPEHRRLVAELQSVLDAEIAPLAVENDARGRYPTASIAALKRSGFLKAVVPTAYGGLGVPHRVSLEAQVRLGAADSAVAQIYKIHDELIREIFVYSPEELRTRLARAVLKEDAILGLAVAESGRKVDDPLATTALPRPDGGFLINGRKIYTTGAAEADLIAVWAFNPKAEGAADNPLLGVQLNLVAPSTAGVDIHRDWDALGQRATDSGTITFSNVETDPAWRANRPGELAPLHASLRYQAGFAAVLIGIGIAAIRAASVFVGTQSRPWPSAGVDNAAEDPYVRRLVGELTADLAAAYAITLTTGDLLDAYEHGETDRTSVAIPIYAAKSAASRAAIRATSEIYALMGTRAAARSAGFDRFWRNARTLSLHDPVDWKNAEIGRHALTGWDPPPGLYQ
ncbi:acyl-CoA dehydrogenase family protein [Methylocapsa sp. S129]|uniref:acyl-CoA dehydrogenase family protein n=1 Tax=Methylocapsa sp. S129 TaxID=1641869 RepID=UPI001AEDA045|nr:acyl-CoA dehydrogenase family protein [Methylocapsa sp. S129]